MEHPSLALKATKSSSLLDKRIVVGVTGSIAAVEMVKLCRELIRHGAQLQLLMTPAAAKIIHPDALEYASGTKPILEFGGQVEYLQLLSWDCFLIAPCTANTLNKLAHGIGDTSVSLFGLVALGRIPVLIAPAMHQSMYESSSVQESIQLLRARGALIIDPVIEEGSAKMASIPEILIQLERELGGKPLQAKRILITSGPTYEQIDPIRIITNRSSGITGRELAKQAYRKGAQVTIVHNAELGLRWINQIKISTGEQMISSVISELEKGYDLLISAAAISDFKPEYHPTKLPTGEHLLRLTPAPKLLDRVRAKFPQLKIVGFKAETNLSIEQLVERARELLQNYKLELVVANDVGKGGIGEEYNDVVLVGKDLIKRIAGHKSVIAAEIISQLERILAS